MATTTVRKTTDLIFNIALNDGDVPGTRVRIEEAVELLISQTIKEGIHECLTRNCPNMCPNRRKYCFFCRLERELESGKCSKAGVDRLLKEETEYIKGASKTTNDLLSLPSSVHSDKFEKVLDKILSGEYTYYRG